MGGARVSNWDMIVYLKFSFNWITGNKGGRLDEQPLDAVLVPGMRAQPSAHRQQPRVAFRWVVDVRRRERVRREAEGLLVSLHRRVGRLELLQRRREVGSRANALRERVGGVLRRS